MALSGADFYSLISAPNIISTFEPIQQLKTYRPIEVNQTEYHQDYQHDYQPDETYFEVNSSENSLDHLVSVYEALNRLQDLQDGQMDIFSGEGEDTSYLNRLLERQDDQMDAFPGIGENMAHLNRLQERQDAFPGGDKDTAYLVQKTRGQALMTLGTGLIATALIYSLLLLVTPNLSCSSTGARDSKNSSRNIESVNQAVSEAATMSGNVTRGVVEPVMCQAAAKPLVTSVILAWGPLLAYSLATGFLVSRVQLEEM